MDITRSRVVSAREFTSRKTGEVFHSAYVSDGNDDPTRVVPRDQACWRTLLDALETDSFVEVSGDISIVDYVRTFYAETVEVIPTPAGHRGHVPAKPAAVKA